ncbi:MAG TPA: hypothetical protein EYP56_07125 [Planctomycetaceae bacterium]|nr:hypothetical protein [Planctomycetaceae bacterium]HIQ20127.1 hypothetical protein [Planctomycetota bacterium]
MQHAVRWAVGMAAVMVVCLMLRLYRPTEAAPPPVRPPFANAVEQRMEMIKELSAIRQLLKEQNQLLKQQNALLRSLVPDRAGAKQNR